MQKLTSSEISIWIAKLLTLAVILSLSKNAQATALKFYDDDPIWQEPTTQDASGMRLYEPELLYDVSENLFTRPGDKNVNKRAQNVNTVDEVPDGEWFVNRAGLKPLTPEEVAQASNTSTGPVAGKWVVIDSKSDGITPGFTVKDSAGTVWFLKFDPHGYRAMATGTEVVVAKLFWALGYHVTEYYIAKLQLENLEISDGAKIKPPGAKERRLRRGDLGWMLKPVNRESDGSYRVIASKATPGQKVGRIGFYGTRPDDPNDIVPHEHRRELRGYGVFSAWFNHVDVKSINSIDVLVKESGREFVRHYLLDFGSTLGSAAVGPREYWEGYEYLLQPSDVGKGMYTFGFRIPAWRTVPYYQSRSIGRLPRDNTKWDPEGWKPRIPNPAFLHARLDDKFWAARKAMAISDDMIRAAAKEGQFGDPKSEEFLVKAIMERRDSVGRRYLPAINPVVDPALDAEGLLTFGNAAVASGFAKAPEGYKAVWSTVDNASGATAAIGESTGKDSKIQAPSGLPATTGSFVRVEISAVKAPNTTWENPVYAYFRHSDGSWKLVGFERMPEHP